MNRDEAYTIQELRNILEDIQREGDGILSFPKALMCLTKEVMELRWELHKLKAQDKKSYEKN